MGIKEIDYNVNGDRYAIRLQQTPLGWVIAGFQGDKQVTFYYGVSFEVGVNFQQSRGESAIDALVEIVKSDLNKLSD